MVNITSSKRDMIQINLAQQLGGWRISCRFNSIKLKNKARCDKPATIQKVSQVCVSKLMQEGL